MQFVIRFWYIILLAFVLSLVSAGGLIYLQKDSLVVKRDPLAEARAESKLTGMSEEYLKWNYEISGVEDLNEKMQAEWESIQAERQELELLRSRILAESDELTQLRDEIDEMRRSLDASYIEVAESEEANLSRLAKIYSEMKPDAAVRIFSDLDMELVIMILARMGEEPASRILSEMSTGDPEGEMPRKAALITEMIRKVK